MSSSSQDQQPTVSGPIQSQLHLTQQMTTYWPQFKVSRQRYAGTLFEEQSMLHMPQKHKDTVQDSTLCMEMNALEQADNNTARKLHARALNRDMSVSRTSWHKKVILGRNSVFRVFCLYLWLSDLMLQ